jgi:hypothetical protein|nr:MAG TPA: Terminase small subunit [Caudoviricetes sp.]
MAVKKNTGGTKRNNPTGIGLPASKSSLTLEDGDNAKFTSMNLHFMNLPKIDLHDEKAVQDRLNEYFDFMIQNDMKPSVSGMAMALGLDRRRLWEIKTGNTQGSGALGGLSSLPQEVTDLVKKAYQLLECLWEDYMLNGKINPMAGVFLGVNNYGYQDVKKVDVTPVLPDSNKDNDYDPDSIRERYLIDSGNDSDSESD